MRKTKENSGITLIALIVTIIVLLILAAVSVKLIGGSEGILGKTSNAINKYKIAKKQEKDVLDEYENTILSKYSGNIASNNNGSGVVTTRQIDEEEYNNLKETVGIQQNVISDQQNTISLQQSRIDTQQNTINILVSTLSSLTNTVSGLQSQMTSLSSSSGGVNINKPNTWSPGTEYDFGNGIYGRRCTGELPNINLKTITLFKGYSKVFQWGGNVDISGGSNVGFQYASDMGELSGIMADAAIFYSISNNDTRFIIKMGDTLAGHTFNYDIWVLYTKK